MDTADVFYILLQKRRIASSDPEYAWYLDSTQHQDALQAMAQSFDCRILDRNRALWLVPNAENEVLGFSRTALKKRLCRSNQGLRHYYLFMFLLLVLLDAFYGTEYGAGRLRQFLKLEDWMNLCLQALRAGKEQASDYPQVPFKIMEETYSSLRPELDHPDKLGYRLQLHTTLLRFLEEQNLAVYLEKEGQIFVTERMDVLVDDLLRSDQDLSLMQSVMEGEPYAETF